MKKIFLSLTVLIALAASLTALYGCNSSTPTAAKFTITGAGQ